MPAASSGGRISECLIPEPVRLNESSDGIDQGYVERERTSSEIIEVGIQLHVAGLSRSNTIQYLERLGVERSRTAMYNWVPKTDVQPTSDAVPNHIAIGGADQEPLTPEEIIGYAEELREMGLAMTQRWYRGTSIILERRLSATMTATASVTPFRDWSVDR